MLPRAALRSTRPSSLHISHLRNGASIAAAPSLRRTYASSNSNSKPPRPPPPPQSSRPPKPPPPRAFQGASGPARQTSPGTAVPKDKTWKPKDGIKFDGAAAAPVVAAGQATATTRASSPVEGARRDDSAVKRESPLEGDAPAPREPIAQKTDSDEPVPGTVRDQARDKIAESEQQEQPPETPQQPTGPLPDLRQGIPSTFEFEFGQGKEELKKEGTTAEASQEEKLDLTSESEGGKQRREREDREYDRSAYETSLDRRRARVANYMYASILVAAAGAAAYFARPLESDEEVPKGTDPEIATGWSPTKMYARVRARMGSQVGYYTEPSFPKLLPDVPESQRPPFTLVLSLEDLMIHTTWDTKHGYRTAKRPGIDYFIRYLSQYYELVLFTSVPRAMADPVAAKLDPYHFIQWPLGREATKYEQGEYVKDLSYLNRDLKKTLIVDTHAPHVKNQPENAIIIPKWSGDPKDPHTKDLVSLIPFLEYVATMGIDDVRTVLKSFEGKSIPEEFARREAEARKKFNEQLAEERKRKPKFSLGSIAGSLGVKGGGSMGGGMVLADGQSVSEGLAQGKMLSDQIREQGQKQYEHLEKQIREHGEQWLKEEAEEQKKLMDAQMKDMKKGAMSWFGGSDK
ncbi:Mitochondrial import inner membrane translocase subunit tim50 [Lecanosticta acicola]|uniref:Mitochondrial import inner membrane translocase subunit TIM50 n=1 Tax=Lecanosticta acicola TaxID=111012 RepID=A0AAI9EDU5_9PEZI|nr:Mitochondrial import inner membrane translocase subunit tim50 [Lecanosticta acicola]